MTNKQMKVLAALLAQPTKEKAAQAAGVSTTTLKRYLSDAEFQAAYKAALSDLVADASSQARQGMEPALAALRQIVENKGEVAQARISAARSILEFSLKLTEIADVLQRLDALEASMKDGSGYV